MVTLHQRHQSPASASSISRRSAITRLASYGTMATLLATSRVDLAVAQDTQAQAPNHFELAGKETEITYDTTSTAGQAQFSYHGPFGDLDVSGDEISTEGSAHLGRLISIQLKVVPDAYRLDLTLLLPGINLSDDNEPQDFSTLAILTKHLMNIGGPGMVDGALKTCEAVELEGTAQFVTS